MIVFKVIANLRFAPKVGFAILNCEHHQITQWHLKEIAMGIEIIIFHFTMRTDGKTNFIDFWGKAANLQINPKPLKITKSY